MNPPIIHRPERQARAKRTLYTTVTAAAWMVYFYLWLPLVTLLAWLLGVRTTYGRLYLQQHAVDPFVLLALPVIALVCALFLLGWAEYNRVRFQGNDRRQPMPPVTDAAVALAMGADPAIAASLRGGRIVTVDLDPQARPSAALAMQVPVAVAVGVPVPISASAP